MCEGSSILGCSTEFTMGHVNGEVLVTGLKLKIDLTGDTHLDIFQCTEGNLS